MYLYKEIATFKNNHLHSFRIDEAAFFSKSPLTLQKICDQIITTYVLTSRCTRLGNGRAP